MGLGFRVLGRGFRVQGSGVKGWVAIGLAMWQFVEIFRRNPVTEASLIIVPRNPQHPIVLRNPCLGYYVSAAEVGD